MNDLNQKSRFAIDLDDLERQLRGMQANEAKQPAADPLAELAKLVGQDDPLKDVFAPQARQTADLTTQPEDRYAVPVEDLRGSVDEFDAIFDRQMRDEVAPAQAKDSYDALQDDLAREVLASIVPEARAEAGHAGAALAADPLAQLDDMLSRDLDKIIDEQRAPVPQPEGHGDFAAMGAVAAGAAMIGAAASRGQVQPEALDEPDASQDLPRKRFSKGALTAAVMVVIGVIGIGVAAVWRGGKAGDGEPRVIRAEPGPTRVQPQNQGGTEVPDQNKQIFDRAGAPKPADTKVVNRDEQPVDVQAAVRNQPRVIFPGAASSGTPTEATQPTSPTATPPAAGLGEPRRVRTVAIRPDG
ncbi:MAG: hypothetical protein ACRCWO_02275, partial [Bosea sp. (in: a-proteobacteria)]